MHYLLLAVAFALLLGGAVLFTNAVEWAGIRLHLGTGAVGSLLAAVATALPESVIPILAILTGSSSDQIAIGSILGAPFLLGTLAMLLVGVSTHVFTERREQDTTLDIHGPTTARDLVIVAVLLVVAGVLGVVGSELARIIAAIAFVCCYGVYVWVTVRHGGESGEEPSSLYFDPSKGDPPANWMIVAQFLAGVVAIVGGAELFVRQVEHIAEAAGISALVLALIIAPLATELPEKVNSILWSRQGKDALAVGNISGAMVFQSMIPVAVGLAFTDWALAGPTLVVIGCAVVGTLIALGSVLTIRRFALPLMGAWGTLYVGGVVYVAVG